MGLGFPHPAGRYRPRGSALLSPRCWSRRDMEGFLTRGWERILPGCGGTSALAQGATFDPRWLQEPQRISNHPTGLGFPHPTGRYRPEGSAFRPRVVGVVKKWKDSSPGDGNLSSPGAVGPRRWPEGQISPRVGSMSPSQSAITRWGWGLLTLNLGDLRLRPRVVEVVDIWKGF